MRLLNIESSPRGSRSASIAVTSAFVEAYRQAYPGVIVDTLNVWKEKLPGFRPGGHRGQVQRRVQTTDGSGRDRRLGQNPGAGSTLPASGPHRARRAYVELRLPLQAQAID